MGVRFMSSVTSSVSCTVSDETRKWLYAQKADEFPNIVMLVELHWPGGEIRGWRGELAVGSENLFTTSGLRFKIEDFEVFASTTELERAINELNGSVGYVCQNSVYFGFSEAEVPNVHERLFGTSKRSLDDVERNPG